MAGYLGSKGGAGVYQAIISQFPPHDFFIEAFAGSAAITRRLPYAVGGMLIERDVLQARALRSSLPMSMRARVVVGDALAVLEGLDYGALGRVLIYADPPYLLRFRGKARYRCEFGEAEHSRMFDLFERLRVKGVAIAVSGYARSLDGGSNIEGTVYEGLHARGWRSVSFQAMTRGGVRTENLWMSYPPAVHWHSFAGRDFTDRQRIRRKADRWAASYRQLPVGERLAVLSALLSVDS